MNFYRRYKMTRQEQMKILQEQIRSINTAMVEMSARKMRLEESLHKLQDEEIIARNEQLKAHQK